MKKTALIAITVATMSIASIGFAAPLTDYSAGKTLIDLNWRNGQVHGYDPSTGDSLDFAKKSNLDLGVTTGLGNKFAIQYNYYNSQSQNSLVFKDTLNTTTGSMTIKTQELNVLYKLDDKVSVYTGFVKLNMNFDSMNTFAGINTASSGNGSKSTMQLGLVGSTKLAAKTTAYASAGVASNFTNWKMGLSQEIAPNLSLNLDYRKIDVRKCTINSTNGSGSGDLSTKGFGVGVSYQF